MKEYAGKENRFLKSMAYGLSGVALAASAAGCYTPRVNPDPSWGSNVSVADMVRATGIDLGAGAVPREALQEAVEGECDITLATDFNNLLTNKTETVLSCDEQIDKGRTENRWRLNVNSLCGVLYRDRSVGNLGLDIDWLTQDELYFKTREGNAFSIYMDEFSAKKFSGLLSAILPANAKDCVSVAQFELANYTPLKALEGRDRIEKQKYYAQWFKEHGKPKYAVLKGMGRELP